MQERQEVNAHRKDHPAELIERNQREVASIGQEEDVSQYKPNPKLNAKVELFFGNIATVKVDAIVNAANESLLGGGGVDAAIHNGAGRGLFEECERLPIDRYGQRCAVGEAKITSGHNLPAKFVVHTVAPLLDGDGQPQPELLKLCYESCLAHIDGTKVRSMAFCCLGTGFYGFPMVAAAKIAMGTVRDWLEKGDNLQKADKMVFAVYTDLEQEAYSKLMPQIFPSA